nr:hypothetical protein Iba_chr01fCG9500 [Ipomoea batatas]
MDRWWTYSGSLTRDVPESVAVRSVKPTSPQETESSQTIRLNQGKHHIHYLGDDNKLTGGFLSDEAGQSSATLGMTTPHETIRSFAVGEERCSAHSGARHIAGRAPRPQNQRDPASAAHSEGPGLEYGLGPGSATLSGSKAITAGKSDSSRPLDQGRVDLFLDGLAARREGTLTVHPGQLVPDLRVNEGGEGTPWLWPRRSGLRLAEFLLGLFSSVLGGCELLLQLLNSTLGRGGLLLKRHTSSFSQMPSSARALLKSSVVVWESCEKRKQIRTTAPVRVG